MGIPAALQVASTVPWCPGDGEAGALEHSASCGDGVRGDRRPVLLAAILLDDEDARDSCDCLVALRGRCRPSRRGREPLHVAQVPPGRGLQVASNAQGPDETVAREFNVLA